MGEKKTIRTIELTWEQTETVYVELPHERDGESEQSPQAEATSSADHQGARRRNEQANE